MKAAFLGLGFKPVFEKVAIKPGKPVWLSHRSALGNRRGQVVLGLPGNSHSVFVCAHLFLSHLLRRVVDWKVYQLGADLPPNGARERFIRAVIDRNAKVSPVYTNNGLTVSIALTEVLIRRAPFADGLEAGQCVECLHINY